MFNSDNSFNKDELQSELSHAIRKKNGLPFQLSYQELLRICKTHFWKLEIFISNIRILTSHELVLNII